MRIVARDVRSTTSRNIKLIQAVSGLSPWDYSKQRIKADLPRAVVPENSEWRTSLLRKLLKLRFEQSDLGADTGHISSMIDSLCTT